MIQSIDDCLCIICTSITLCSQWSYADELASRIIRILGMRLTKDSTRAIQKDTRFIWGSYWTLCIRVRRIRSRKHVSLDPLTQIVDKKFEEKSLHSYQVWMVVVPPLRTVAPPTTPTAVGTLFRWMLLSTRDPWSWLLLVVDVRTNIGVFVTVASMIASAPIVCIVSMVWVLISNHGIVDTPDLLKLIRP